MIYLFSRKFRIVVLIYFFFLQIFMFLEFNNHFFMSNISFEYSVIHFNRCSGCTIIYDENMKTFPLYLLKAIFILSNLFIGAFINI